MEGMTMEKRIAVIGAGSFGTALAKLLTDKGYDVSLWGRRKSQVELMIDTRENPHYLPGINLPEQLKITDDLTKCLSDCSLAVFSVPAQSFRSVLQSAKKLLTPDTVVVNVAKGIEKDTLMTLSRVAYQVMPEIKYAVLSGPSHAEEVARQLPTTVAVASKEAKLALEVQETFNTDRFRVYTNDDMIGVELGGALKNIIALGAGKSDGIGFGDNACHNDKRNDGNAQAGNGHGSRRPYLFRAYRNRRPHSYLHKHAFKKQKMRHTYGKREGSQRGSQGDRHGSRGCFYRRGSLCLSSNL